MPLKSGGYTIGEKIFIGYISPLSLISDVYREMKPRHVLI